MDVPIFGTNIRDFWRIYKYIKTINAMLIPLSRVTGSPCRSCGGGCFDAVAGPGPTRIRTWGLAAQGRLAIVMAGRVSAICASKTGVGGRDTPLGYQDKRSLEKGLAIRTVTSPSWPGLSGPTVAAQVVERMARTSRAMTIEEGSFS